MKNLSVAYFYNAAYFAVVPHGDELTIFHFDVLLTINMYGEMSGFKVYKYLHEYWRRAYINSHYRRLDYLLAHGYLNKTGIAKTTIYSNTGKSLLLIAQVERKLAALVKEQKEANKMY